MEIKPFWKSKTFWANAIMGAAAFAPKVREHLTPETISTIIVFGNMGLRFISKGKITLT